MKKFIAIILLIVIGAATSNECEEAFGKTMGSVAVALKKPNIDASIN